MGILLMALSWNEFANALEPTEIAPDAQPIVFRKEYMIPVEKQTLGRNDEASGVLRILPRMLGPQGDGPHLGA